MQTSWEKSSKWYSKTVGQYGHYYHQHLVIPNSLRLLNLENRAETPANSTATGTTRSGDVRSAFASFERFSLIDLACGQGILARSLPKNINYLGLDISPSLISAAQKLSKHRFKVADVSKIMPNEATRFSHASIILALQNIENQNNVIQNAFNFLQPNGKLLIVLNHPSFRIPRQSSWEIDPQNKIEYRRINRYLSPLKIPIYTNPSDPKSPITWSFHHPLSHYFDLLSNNNFVVTHLEEWASDKESVGKAARMENRARSEFPLFLAILAKKSN